MHREGRDLGRPKGTGPQPTSAFRQSSHVDDPVASNDLQSGRDPPGGAGLLPDRRPDFHGRVPVDMTEVWMNARVPSWCPGMADPNEMGPRRVWIQLRLPWVTHWR